MSDNHSPVLIAGAGVSGLGVALGLARHGRRSIIVDPRREIGGLACTRRRDGRVFQAGIHLIHPSADHLKPLICEMDAWMGPDALWVETNAKIHFQDRHFSYPLRLDEILSSLGARRSASVAASALAARVESTVHALFGKREDDSFESIIRRAYGDRLYRMFFRDYTAKVLGVPPRHIAGEWAHRRVPMPSVWGMVMTLLPSWRPTRVVHPHAPFSRRQLVGPDGLDAMFDGMLQECGDRTSTELGTAVDQVEVHEGRVRAVRLKMPDGTHERLETTTLVSTIPLPDLVSRIDPAPPASVLEAARRLRFRGLAFVFLVLRLDRLLPAQWVYYQDAVFPFNRASEMGNIVPGLYERGLTIVCAEVGADEDDATWCLPDEDLIRDTAKGLSRASGLNVPDLLAEAVVVREPHAYPLWTVGFQSDLALVLDWVDGIEGLVTTGRQGRFDYLNIDECIHHGFEAADRVVKGTVAPKGVA